MEQAKNRLLLSISSSRTFYIVAGVFVFLYFTILAFYILPPKVTPETHTLFSIQWYLPIVLFIPAFFPKAFILLDKITNVRVWNILCYIILVGCIVAHIMQIPGLWWSWMTTGLSFVIIVLVMNITKGKISGSGGLLLGCGCVLLTMAVWEAFVYQLGLIIFHSSTAFGTTGVKGYLIVVNWNMIWALQGLGLLMIIQLKYRKEGLININSTNKIFIAIFAIFTALMFIMRFPIAWHNPEFNLTMCIMRGSKAFFGLSLVTLFIPVVARDKATFYDTQLNSSNPIRSWFHRTRHRIIKELVVDYHNNKNGQIADLGCGNCIWNKDLRLRVTGIDKDKEAVNYSIRQGRIEAGIVADLAETTLPSDSMETVVCSEVLEHTTDCLAVLLEIKRILKPNKYLILSVPHDTIKSLWKPLFWLQCLYQGRLVNDRYYKERCGHINHFSPEKIKDKVKQAGFEVIRVFSPHRMTIFLVARKKV